MRIMITVKSLSVSAKNKTILDNISFSVEKGSFCAILGKNGSGKSTLLDAFLNFHEKDLSANGEILINETNIRHIKRNDIAKKISFLPQHLPSPPVTVLELVSYGRSPYHTFTTVPDKNDREIIDLSLETSGCKDLSERLVPTLSGGEKQKAFLAMILAQDTDIMLLDEPTSDMDIGAQDEFLKILKKCSLSGKTILAVLHDINGAFKYADDILILDKGENVFFGSKESCLSSSVTENTFGIKKYTLPCGSDVFLA